MAVSRADHVQYPTTTANNNTRFLRSQRNKMGAAGERGGMQCHLSSFFSLFSLTSGGVFRKGGGLGWVGGGGHREMILLHCAGRRRRRRRWSSICPGDPDPDRPTPSERTDKLLSDTTTPMMIPALRGLHICFYFPSLFFFAHDEPARWDLDGDKAARKKKRRRVGFCTFEERRWRVGGCSDIDLVSGRSVNGMAVWGGVGGDPFLCEG